MADLEKLGCFDLETKQIVSVLATLFMFWYAKSQKVTKFTFVLLMLMPETDRICINFADKNEYLTMKN